LIPPFGVVLGSMMAKGFCILVDLLYYLVDMVSLVALEVSEFFRIGDDVGLAVLLQMVCLSS